MIINWHRVTIEKQYTRDLKVPCVEGDSEFNYGWSSVPQAPDPPDGWEIFDQSKQYKTGWLRRSVNVGGQVHVLVHDCLKYLGRLRWRGWRR
jgi:hypothetical protein